MDTKWRARFFYYQLIHAKFGVQRIRMSLTSKLGVNRKRIPLFWIFKIWLEFRHQRFSKSPYTKFGLNRLIIQNLDVNFDWPSKFYNVHIWTFPFHFPSKTNDDTEMKVMVNAKTEVFPGENPQRLVPHFSGAVHLTHPV